MTELIGLFSGGKDSLVACLVAGVKEVLYCRTGVGLNEQYVIDTCIENGWLLHILQPREGEYERFIKKFGFPRPTSHSWIMQRLKLNPIGKWYRQQKKLGRDITLVSGIRTAESKRRKMKFPTEGGIEAQGMRFYRPILRWSHLAVEQYIKDNGLKISPIYNTMGISGDCLCGAFTKRQHGKLLLAYHPELAERLKILEQEAPDDSKWGQFMSLTACEKQGGIEDYICSECMVMPNDDN